MTKTKDLFPQQLEEAKRYKKHKRQLTKVMAKQHLEEDYEDSAIDWVLDIIREIGPTNSLGIWVEARERLGYEQSPHKLSVHLSRITMLLNVAGRLWRHDLKYSDSCVFGIIGEQNKQEYLSETESNKD